MIKFYLYMTPRGQGRPRAARRGSFVSVYKDAKSRQHEDTIASLAQQYRPETPIDYPVKVTIIVVAPRPAYLSRVSKSTGQPVLNPDRVWNTAKPDADNYAKAVLDGLQAFWLDDKLVVDLKIQKVVAAYQEAPGFHITIEPVGLAP